MAICGGRPVVHDACGCDRCLELLARGMNNIQIVTVPPTDTNLPRPKDDA